MQAQIIILNINRLRLIDMEMKYEKIFGKKYEHSI
jgi:hypothetical protein